MSVLNTVSLLTFFEETTQGIGPSGASGVSTSVQWQDAEVAGNAFQVPHLAASLGTASIVAEEVAPEQVRRRVFETAATVSALSNVEFAFQSYLTGSGQTTADGSQPDTTALSRLLGNALGGTVRAATRTLTGGGHSATVINVDDVTTWAVGAVVAWEDDDGRLHPRVITDITGTAVTLNTALPATPADAQLVRGGITAYIDESVITDTSSNAGSTLSGVIQKGANGSAGFEVNGCKLALSSVAFERNGFPTVDFDVSAARHTDPSLGPSPTLPTAVFPAPQVIGPDSSIIIEDAGTTTLTGVCNGTATVEPGVPVTPLECMADNLGDMEGIGLYSTSPADTTIELDLFPFDVSLYNDKRLGTNKQLLIMKNGTAGNCFAFIAQNCEIQSHAFGEGEFTNSALTLRAVEHAPGTATTDLERSKFRIFIG